jgi:hypothetical protein
MQVPSESTVQELIKQARIIAEQARRASADARDRLAVIKVAAKKAAESTKKLKKAKPS